MKKKLKLYIIKKYILLQDPEMRELHKSGSTVTRSYQNNLNLYLQILITKILLKL